MVKKVDPLVRAAQRCAKEVHKHQNYLNSYGLVFDDGTSTTFLNKACYASLLWSKFPVGNNRIVYFTDWALGKKDKFEEYEIEYMDWLANRSHFAPAFKTKNVDIIMNRGTIYHTNFRPQYVIAAAMALRYVNEFPKRIKYWSMIKDHIDSHAALVYSHIISEEDSEYYTLGKWYSGHSFICNEKFGRKRLKSMIEGRLNHKSGRHMSQHTNYGNLDSIWDGRESPDTSRFLHPKGISTEKQSFYGSINTETYKFRHIVGDSKKWLEMNLGGIQP